MEQQLRALSDELGPLTGVKKLYQAAKRQGIDVTEKQVKTFISQRGVKQQLAKPMPSKGKTAAAGKSKEYSRWMADLIQMRQSKQTHTPSVHRGSSRRSGSLTAPSRAYRHCVRASHRFLALRKVPLRVGVRR